MKERLNITKSLVNKEIKDNWSLKELVSFIKNPPNTHITKVKASRELFKVCKDSYERVKLSFPCFIPNFTFKNKYVKGSNLDLPTGYLYIDIDDNTSIDLNSPYIAAYWKSLSNEGYTVIVSVDGLDKSKLRESTKYVSDKLNLPLDSCAISIDRNVVISYDPNAYYNKDSQTIQLPTHSRVKQVHKPVKLTRERKEGLTVLCNNSKTDKLRTNNLDDIIGDINFEGEVMVDLGMKVEYANVGSVYLKVPVGKRNSSLFFMGCQVKALNTWASLEDMMPYMRTINKDGMSVPVSDKELITICRNVIKKYLNGELKLYKNKSRRFLFNPDYELSATQKRSLVAHYINKMTVKKNRAIVKKYIAETGVYNKTEISEAVGLSRNTVSKYVNMELVRKMIEEDGITDIVEMSRKCKIRPHTVQEYMKELAEVVDD